jgi:hypothetical protein
MSVTRTCRRFERLARTFCNASRVVLTGSSAGGFGSVFEYAQVAQAFAPTRVDRVDDSGPPLDVDAMALQTTMRTAWSSAVNDPPGCRGCTWDQLIPLLSSAHPEARFSLLSRLVFARRWPPSPTT